MEWRDVLGFEGWYQVSDTGLIKRTRGGRGARIGVLQQSVSGSPRYGYMGVTLWKEGKPSSKKVHRLVLEAFSGPCPVGMEACHNNGDRLDNRRENLRWDTHFNNCAERRANFTYPRIDKNGHLREGPGVCPECQRSQQADRSKRNATRITAITADRTRCRNGHSVTEEGTYTDRIGRKQCRQCRADADNRRYAKKYALRPKQERRLDPMDIADIRAKYASGGISQVVIAMEYGVNQTLISAIVRRSIYVDVE